MRRAAEIGSFVTLATLAIVAGVAKLRAPSRTSSRSEAPPSPSASFFGISAPLGSSAKVPARTRTLHGDARRTHRSPFKGPREAKLGWKTSIGAPIEAQIVTSPDESTLYVAALDGKLRALDRAGHEKWRVDLGDRAYATPLVDDEGVVYAGSDAKELVAVAPDGKVRWRFDAGGEIDTAPALTEDGSIVLVAGADVLSITRRGTVQWRFSAKKKIFTAPALTEGLVIVGSQDHHLYGIEAGKARFAVDLGADVDGAPVIADDGSIFVGTDGGEIARANASGEIAWRAQVGGFVRGALSLARNGDVLAGVYGPGPRVVRVTAEGAIRGALSVPGTGARELGVHGGPLEDAEGKLYFGAQDDVLRAIGERGEELFRVTAEADIDAPVTLLGDGSLVFAADDGYVYYLGP